MRRRQIDTLKIFNINVQEVKENEEYLVNFDSGGREIAINIILGSGFPNEKPKLIISPILNHPWINSNTGEIEKAPGILNYTIHSDLGRVVQAISREFEKRPPSLLNETPSTPQHTRDSNGAENRSAASPSVEQDTFGLHSLSIEELARLNTDEDYLEMFIDNLGFVKNQNNEMEQLMAQIEAIAIDNLAKKKLVDCQQEKIEEMFSNFKELGEKYETSNQKYQKKSEDFSPQHIKELLQISVATADAKSDEEAHRFLAGETDVSTFLNNFIETRKIFTMRKAKEERLTQQLTALERATF